MEAGAGLNDPCSSLPIQDILCFYENNFMLQESSGDVSLSWVASVWGDSYKVNKLVSSQVY